ncbi:MAG: hypothetical protein MPEBLZ_03611, partial [Candidatus Methanoperedens nitroreducens]
MSNNDVAEIRATLKNIGVSAASEQIKNSDRSMLRARKLNEMPPDVCQAAGVNPSALYKGSSTPIHVADVK